MKIDKQYGNELMTNGKNICGIYCISNSKYFYIGLSSNIRQRWNSHKFYLRKGVHCNKFMQNVYNKYNINDPFKYEIICECERKDLGTLEKSIYDEYCKKFSDKIPMNIANCGYVNNWTDEMKAKASKTHKGIKLTKKHRENISKGQIGNVRLYQRVKMVQLSLNGELIKIWDSKFSAENELGININMKRKTCGGFQWQRYDNWKTNPKGPVEYKTIKEVFQYSKNGDFIAKYKSIQEASDITGIKHCNISNTICGRQSTAGGFIWKI